MTADDRPFRFVSPHYDDIALSCGGLVAALANAGIPTIAEVVFGEEPDTPLSDFASAMHQEWGLAARDVIARRRSEEQRAAAVLGMQMGNLPFRDAIYRGTSYTSNEQLFGRPASEEALLPDQIVASLNLPAPGAGAPRLVVPLAVGEHVDHQIVFRAGVSLARAGHPVWFFEDLPYALNPGALTARLERIRADTRVEPILLEPVASVWNRKIDAIMAYPSQLQTIFKQYTGVDATRDAISRALLAYAKQNGDGTAVERYWQLAP